VAQDKTTATYEIDLQSNVSGAAESAARALDSLRKSINADQKELAALKKAMNDLQGGASVDIKAFRDLKARIDAKKQSISSAQAAYVGLGGSFRKTSGDGKNVRSMLEQLTTQAKATPGPIGDVVGKLGNLRSLVVGGAIALGIIAIVAGMVALTAAAIAASSALLKYGLAQANARRAELLRLEGLTKMRNWWGIAAGNAAEMQTAIDKVSGSTALGRDKLSAYTEQLYKMGLRGQNLSEALEGMAIKAATQGDEAAKLWAGWAQGIALTGGSVKKLTDDVRARLGGIAAAQLLDLNVQTEKLRENFGLLFADLKIDGFLKSLNSITSLFSQSTATGRALKTMISAVFQPMINAVEYLGPIVKRFFQGMTLGALLITLELLKLRNWFRKTFGDSEILAGFDAQTAALKAGLFVVMGLAAGVAVLAAGFFLLLSPMLAIVGAGVAVGYALTKAFRFVMGIEWGKLGRSIIDGIVGGLKRGAKWALDAIKSLGAQMMTAFKEKLGIASPSKEFARLGATLPQGVQVGVQRGTPGAQSAVENMVSVPAEQRAAGAVSSSASVSTGDIHIHAQGATAAELMADVQHQLESILRRVAMQMGATVPGAVA